MAEPIDLGMQGAVRVTFTADQETVQIDHCLPGNRGHQYTVKLYDGDLTGRELELFLRPVTDTAKGKTATPVSDLDRPVYQNRSTTTDIPATSNIVAKGTYDIRGDACHLVIRAAIADVNIGDPIVVDVFQLVG